MSVPPTPPSQPGGPFPGQQPYQQPYQPPKKKRRIWPWVLGIILVIIIGGFAACTAVVGTAVNEVDKESKTTVKITYKVIGDGPAILTYDVNGKMTQDTNAQLPWTKETEVTGLSKYVSFSASNGIESGGGKITCQVLRDGKVIIENTANGPGATASCSGDVSAK
jgi:hypothetical protein